MCHALLGKLDLFVCMHPLPPLPVPDNLQGRCQVRVPGNSNLSRQEHRPTKGRFPLISTQTGKRNNQSHKKFLCFSTYVSECMRTLGCPMLPPHLWKLVRQFHPTFGKLLRQFPPTFGNLLGSPPRSRPGPNWGCSAAGDQPGIDRQLKELKETLVAALDSKKDYILDTLFKCITQLAGASLWGGGCFRRHIGHPPGTKREPLYLGGNHFPYYGRGLTPPGHQSLKK